jgi:hypothetical protein
MRNFPLNMHIAFRREKMVTDRRAIAFGSISIFAVMDRSYNTSHHGDPAALAVRAGHACDNGLPHLGPNAIILSRIEAPHGLPLKKFLRSPR